MKDKLIHNAFVIISLILYEAFLTMDIFSVPSVTIKYMCIVLCFAMALYLCITRKMLLPAVTCGLTLFADTFLLLLDNYYILGVTAFALVQTIYGLYIVGKSCRTYISVFTPRIIIYVIITATITVLQLSDIIVIISLWSYVNLIFNVLQSRKDSMLALGMFLFLACDTCVGLANLAAYTHEGLSASALHIITYLIWLFYLPSQVLILLSFSGKPRDKSDHENDHTVNISTTRKTILPACLTILTTLWVLTFSVAIPIIFRPFYYVQIDARELAMQTGYTNEQIRTAYDEMLDYCLGINSEFGTGDLAWSESGKAHFTDVRDLFLLDITVMVITGTLLTAYFIYAHYKRISTPKIKGQTPYFYGCLLLLASFTIIGLLCATDFDRAFTIFHTLFFPGKTNWLFNPSTDQIIRILPQGFFASCAACILTALILICATIMARSIQSLQK